MNYQEFLEYIYQRHSGNVKLGLERMEAVLSEMNNPNLELRGIHIAGTNGKGSTAAICESLSLSAGLKTGLNSIISGRKKWIRQFLKSVWVEDWTVQIRLNPLFR